MDALDSKTLDREAIKGFYMFLYSEAKRHQDDIQMIWEKMHIIEERESFSYEEKLKLKVAALDYIDF